MIIHVSTRSQSTSDGRAAITSHRKEIPAQTEVLVQAVQSLHVTGGVSDEDRTHDHWSYNLDQQPKKRD
jgi:hypothetical protein